MDNDLKVGSIVTLKSGGPDMTIVVYPAFNSMGDKDPSKAKCSWFINGEPKFEIFPIAALELSNF